MLLREHQCLHAGEGGQAVIRDDDIRLYFLECIQKTIPGLDAGRDEIETCSADLILQQLRIGLNIFIYQDSKLVHSAAPFLIELRRHMVGILLNFFAGTPISSTGAAHFMPQNEIKTVPAYRFLMCYDYINIKLTILFINASKQMKTRL